MKALRSLNKYFWKYKWHFFLGIAFTVASNYFGVKMPAYVKESIDDLQQTTINPTLESALWLAAKIGGFYLLLSFMKGFFLFLMRQTIIIMSRRIEYDLKNEIYNHYQKLDSSFYKRNRIGDLMNRISEDVSQVRMYLGPGIMYSVNLIVLSVLSISQMLEISLTLTLFSLIPLPLMSLLIYKVSKKINEASKQVQEAQSEITTITQESMAGIRVLKAFNQTAHNLNTLSEASETYKKKSMKLVLINALFMPTILLLIGTSTLLVLYVGGVLTESKSISLGSIVAFIFYVSNLTWPFVSIGWVTSIIQRAEASQKRINEFLKTQPDIQNPTQEPIDLKGKVEFDKVSLTFQETQIQALKEVSFEIDPGASLGVFGKTGSGKSTLIDTIGRLMDPESGEIRIDGQPLKAINLGAYRNQIAVVTQDTFLFSDTIRNNVTFGAKEPVSDEAVIAVLKQAHVWHNIEAFPDGLDTLLGELGVNLSGGQKQRICIARALIAKPKILLLDDCLSAVDTETEDRILNELNGLNPKPTLIMVSHRISTLRNCQNIIVLDEGRIIEKGTQEALLERQGVFYQEYRSQLEDRKKSE
jgi:ATP-binding cassette subfamily B protein